MTVSFSRMGLVALMVERLVRIEEAARSNRARSTWSLV